MRIPAELQEEVVRRAARGQHQKTICAWLRKRHRVVVSQQSISKLLAKHRVARSELSKHIVREHVSSTLPKDLAELDGLFAKNLELLKKAQTQATKDLSVANVEKVVKLTVVVQKADESKKKALGVDQPDTVDHQGLADLVGLALTD